MIYNGIMRKVWLLSFVLCFLGSPVALAAFNGTSFSKPVSTIDIPPEANIRVTSNYFIQDLHTGTTQTTFTFDGNLSRDDRTGVGSLEVRFDFDNDGIMDTYYSKNKVQKHVYNKPGLYTVKMEVLDSGGNVSSATTQVTVVHNTPPQASFTVNPIAGTPATTFRFDTSSSSDSQYKSSALYYRFDWNGDGLWDTNFAGKTIFLHKYATSGTYSVIMEARDPEGLIGHATVHITVGSSPAPTASFSYTKLNNQTTYIFKADAGAVSAVDKPYMQYRWDFDYTGPNDIHFDSNFTTSPQYSITFAQIGTKTVKLQVRNIDGIIAETTQQITISAPTTGIFSKLLHSVMLDIQGFLNQFASNAPVTRGELAVFIVGVKGIGTDGVKRIFGDVPADDPKAAAISKVVELHYMNPYLDGNFYPNNQVNRADGLALFFKAFEIPVIHSITPPPFTDVKANYWFYDYVATAYEKGLVKGTSPTTFSPERIMTRQEAVIIMKRFLYGSEG